MSSDTAAAPRNNNPVENNNPVPLDCCGGLNNVDYSKVKRNKLLCISLSDVRLQVRRETTQVTVSDVGS